MSFFLYSARTQSGRSVTDRVEAESITAARENLEGRCFRDIVFYTDQMTDELTEAARAAIDPARLRPNMSPRLEREAGSGWGIWRNIWLGLKLEWKYVVPLLIWNGLSFYHGRPFPFWAWLGFGTSVVFLINFLIFRFPPVAHAYLVNAVVWNRSTKVRRWVGFFRKFKREFGVGLQEMELDGYLATTMARDGDLPGALELFATHEANPVGRSYFFSKLSGIYEAAEDFQRMSDCRQKAVEESEGRSNEKIDYALGLIRRLRDPKAARMAMDGVNEQDLVEVAQSFCFYCRGLIALEEGDVVAAEENLRTCIKKQAPYRGNPMADGMIKEVKAFLAIAVAAQGKMEEARAFFAEAAPLLQARKEQELLERCRSACGVEM